MWQLWASGLVKIIPLFQNLLPAHISVVGLCKCAHSICYINESVVRLAGHFVMATRDRHGAAWISTCHSDCCSRQGQQDILNAVYRDEKQLTNVRIDFICFSMGSAVAFVCSQDCSMLWKPDIFAVQIRRA